MRDLLLLAALVAWTLRRSRTPHQETPPPSSPGARSIPGTWDRTEAKRFEMLAPAMRIHLARLLATVIDRTGLRLIVGSTRRTLDEQEALYATGKSRVRGPNAPHVRGVAVDLYEPPSAPGSFRPAWQAIARELGWHGMYSWDAGHVERRDVKTS